MSGLVPFYITGYAKGLMNNKKPFLLPDQAWSRLYNAYTWRDRVKKREGNTLLGRLQRNLTGQELGDTVSSQLTYTYSDIFTTLSIPEANAELKPSTLIISIGAPDTATFTDNGTGNFTVTGLGVAAGSYVDYVTGEVVLVLSAATGGAEITGVFSYYPSLPGMGIQSQNLSTVSEQQTIWFDTTYAYIYLNGAFQEFIAGTTWNGNNGDFFWGYNYLDTSSTRLFFVTNFNNQQNGESAADPMYYTAGVSWTSFQPLTTATTTIFQAKLIIPYFGRLLLLNTWEGTTVGGASAAVNYFSRCRFSESGASTSATAFRTDNPYTGGYLDAPTSEQIVGATFVKNTLIVDFDYSTWQLRYQGDYGIPFIWERISSDFGGNSAFSSVLFDNHKLNIGDVGITAGNAVEVNRIDLDIPDQIFDFQNEVTNSGSQRVWGIRDFQKELVFWNYPDANDESVPGTAITYPNKVLVYNYRNQTWAIFRDNVTAFGTLQAQSGVTWSSTNVTWSDENVTWSDPVVQAGFPDIVKINQQGFAHVYANNTQDDPSLSVTAISITSSLIQLTINNHNLFDGDIIYLTGMKFIDSTLFTPVTTNLNSVIYQVSVVDANNINIAVWNFTTSDYGLLTTCTPVLASSIYIGGGQISLFPQLDIITKDINLFQQKGNQTKLSRIEFLMEPQPNGVVQINLYLNATPSLTSAETIGGAKASNPWSTTNYMSIAPPTTFISPASDYLWFPYYATLAAQYFKIQITYDNALMNTLTTHESDMILYAINAWTRVGGRLFSGA